MTEPSHAIGAGGFALPIQPAEANRSGQRVSGELADACTFYFAVNCWRIGAFWLFQGVLLLSIGFFLYVQIPAAPKLTTQLLICSALSVIGAMFTLHMAAWNLLSFLRVDRYGLQMRYGVMAKRIAWGDLDCWRIVENDSSMPAVFLWPRKQIVPWTVPGNALSSKDYMALRAVLNEHAPQKSRV